jgi:hypothetical protein
VLGSFDDIGITSPKPAAFPKCQVVPALLSSSADVNALVAKATLVQHLHVPDLNIEVAGDDLELALLDQLGKHR